MAKRANLGAYRLSTERIKDDTNFEEDLGLVSIDMVKIYSKLVERFPGTGKNVEVI